MSTLYKSFLENFPDEFSIAHKIAPQTEKKTFHMHKQLEVIYTISSNMKCRTEKGIRSIPKNSLVLLNSIISLQIPEAACVTGMFFTFHPLLSHLFPLRRLTFWKALM